MASIRSFINALDDMSRDTRICFIENSQFLVPELRQFCKLIDKLDESKVISSDAWLQIPSEDRIYLIEWGFVKSLTGNYRIDDSLLDLIYGFH